MLRNVKEGQIIDILSGGSLVEYKVVTITSSATTKEGVTLPIVLELVDKTKDVENYYSFSLDGKVKAIGEPPRVIIDLNDPDWNQERPFGSGRLS